MTHPLFKKEIFVETAFARRFQKMLQDAWDNRSWHLLVADPGAGKTMSIRDLQKRAGGRSVLAVVAPKNNDDEQALGDQFLAALGLPIRGHWSTRKPKLMGHLHQYGTECLIVDDAHDLSLELLMLLKEVTDQGRLQYDHPLGLCLVAAGRGDTIPLKETFDLPDPTWLQFRRRFDKLQPFCRIASHTSDEVRAILANLEQAYQPLFPQDQNQRDVPGVNGKEPEQQAVSENTEPNAPSTVETVETAKEQEHTSKTANCTFSGEMVPIDLKRFTDSGINLVECPRCGRMRSLSPAFGRPPVQSTHPSAGQQTPLTEKRWSATGKTDWSVVEG